MHAPASKSQLRSSDALYVVVEDEWAPIGRLTVLCGPVDRVACRQSQFWSCGSGRALAKSSISRPEVIAHEPPGIRIGCDDEDDLRAFGRHKGISLVARVRQPPVVGQSGSYR